jgi:O-antigen ligase
MISEDLKQEVRIKKTLWIFPISILLYSVTVLLVANEITLGLMFISLLVILMSFYINARILFLLLLIPFAHAGLGIDKLGGFGVFDIYSIWFILIFFIYIISVSNFNLKNQTVSLFSLLMILAFVPSLLNSTFLFESFKAFIQLSISIGMTYALYYYLSEEIDGKKIVVLLKVFAFEAIVVSIVGIYQASASSTLSGYLYGRTYFTFFGEVNYYAGYLLFSLPIIVGLFITERSLIIKLLLFFGIVIVTSAIISTVSRSAIFSLIAMALLLLLFLLFRRGSRKFITMISISVFVTIIIIIFTTDVGNKLIDFVTLSKRMETIIQGHDVSVTQRQKIFDVGLRMINAHPIVGFGFGTFERNFDSYKLAELSTGSARAAHNTALKIFAETGFIGFIASLLFIFSLFYNLIRPLTLMTDRNHKVILLSLLVSLASFLIMSLSLDLLFEPHFWITSGIALAYIKVLKNNTSKYNIKQA